MINLKLLDLAYNEFTSLNSIFDPDVNYGKLSELYLNGNKLSDISALTSARTLNVLVLSDNLLEDDDLQLLSSFEFLQYLSLADNGLSNITPLKSLTSLIELRLQNNNIASVRDLRFLTRLEALYLGNNNITNYYTAGGTETNLYYLINLKALKVLYLNDNNIDSIDNLTTLTKLQALNITNNNIQNLSLLSALVPDSASGYPGLLELYGENNEIESFSFINGLTGMKKLMLSGNAHTYEASLPVYLSNLTQLETLTLSGKELKTLRFLQNMHNIIHLNVADCNLPAYYITSSVVVMSEGNQKKLQVNDFDDNIAYILGLKNSLKFLDISDNGFAYTPSDMLTYLSNNGSDLDVSSFLFTSSTPSAFGSLYELSNLVVFYADNLCQSVDATSLLTFMTKIKYLSLEKCGITDVSWINKYRGLVYVNLAGNEISAFNFAWINQLSKPTLQYLYLDTSVPCTFADAYTSFDDNNLKELSLKGISVLETDRLPVMEKIEYLNIADTGITDLRGSDPEFYEIYSIERFDSLLAIDLSGLHADISPILNLPSLQTAYAIGSMQDYVFFKCNLDTLYSLFNDGITSFLYSYDEQYTPSAAREGAVILGLMEDISRTVGVAAENKLSDNNPLLIPQINDYAVNWSVNNSINYEIINNKIGVKDYTHINDESLLLTASITVYPNQNPVTRDFDIATNILRTEPVYISIEADGASNFLVRDSMFAYDVNVVNAATQGFSEQAKPVYDDVRYNYSAVNQAGSSILPVFIISEAPDHRYSILSDAPLGSVLTIAVDVGHYDADDMFVIDESYSKSISIVERTFIVTYELDGGSITDEDGTPITQQQYAEEAELFGGLLITKVGYDFAGWYLDALYENAFVSTTMPSENITLYAKWNAKSFMVSFDPNGGSCSIPNKQVSFNSLYGTLPTPERTHHTFNGWYTEADGGVLVTEETQVALTAAHTLYAHWTPVNYLVSVSSANPSQGSVSGGGSAAYGSTVTITATPATGYSFVQWNDGNTSASRTVTITGDITYTASFTIKIYTVTLNANGGNVTPASITVSHGGTVSLPTPSRTNYTFNGWFNSASGGTRYYNSTPIIGNITLYAQWTLAVVTVPNVIGQDYWTAKTTLQNLGLNVSLASAYNFNVSANNVYAQSIAGGSAVTVGSSITITYSSGPKPLAWGDYVIFTGGYLYGYVKGDPHWKDGSGGYIYSSYYYNGETWWQFTFYGNSTPYGWAPYWNYAQQTN